MKLSRRFDFALVLAGLASSGTALAQQTTPGAGAHEPPAAPAEVTGDFAGDYEVLQPLGDEPGQIRLAASSCSTRFRTRAFSKTRGAIPSATSGSTASMSATCSRTRG